MNIFKEQINLTIIFCSLFIIGVISFFAQIQYFCIVLVACSLIYLLYTKKIRFLMASVLLFSFIFGFLLSDYRVKEADSLFYIAPKNNVTIEGQVVSILETNKTDKTRFYFRADKIKTFNSDRNNLNSKVMVTLLEPKDVYSKINIGDKLSLTGKLRIPSKAANPAEFSYQNYLRMNNTFTTFFVEKGNFQKLSPPDKLSWKFLQKVNEQRNLIIKKHSQILKTPYIELLGGVVFGDDAVTAPDNLKESFKISGLLHLLAASGLNVGIIFSIWFFIGKICRFDYKLNTILGALLILVYTCMTGFSPSILRATLMIEFVLFGKLIDRQADNVALICFVCFLMLLYNPSWICSIGFQLSFLVTTGLIISMPYINDFCSNHFNKFWHYILTSISIPLIAQIFVLPLQMFYFNTFTLYSVIANILVLPFITVVSFIGFISSVLSIFTFIPDFIIKYFDIFLSPFLVVTVKISDFISGLPYANFITIQPNIFQIFVYYLLLIFIILFIKFKNKKLLYSFIVLFIALLLSFIKIPDNKLHLTFFAVKNADSSLIKTPKNHYFVIDTGKKSFNNSYSQGDTIIAKYLLSQKVTKIDFIILSHLDNDHIGGTVGLLDKIKVKKVYVNSDIPNTTTAKELFNYLKVNNIPYEIVKNNSTLYEEENLKLKAYLKESIDENENSIINLLTYKNFNAIYMGDAGVNGFDILPKSLKIDVLKLGHHGAKGTINTSTIEKFTPKTVIVSTGQNQYGHPHINTIDILSEANLNYFRTDERNAIDVVFDGKTTVEKCFSTKQNKFLPCEK